MSSSSSIESNKLIKALMDASVITGLTAGIGYLGKKVLKENFLGDPSSSLGNYGKLTLVIAGSIAAKQYLEDKKIIPSSV